jgi:hypothetical protein
VSRRHHGGRPHRSNGHANGQTQTGHSRPAPAVASPSPSWPVAELPTSTPVEPAPPGAAHELDAHAPSPSPLPPAPMTDAPAPATTDHATNGAPISFAPQPDGAPHANGYAPGPHGHAPEPPAGCTAPQLRRFIKSRPYVPMHELRRRFGIDGGEDDVTPVDLASGRIFVGLPPREGGLLGELLRGGDIGYELSLDPRSPIVVGLYPMRPVARA